MWHQSLLVSWSVAVTATFRILYVMEMRPIRAGLHPEYRLGKKAA